MSSLLEKMRARIKADDEFETAPEEYLEVDNGMDILARVGMTQASELQRNIFIFADQQIQNYQNSLVARSLAIQAVAGSGKSTTIVAAAKLIPRNMKAIFLAFNKSIADELRERLPSHVEARTLNSLGNRIIQPYLQSIGLKSPEIRSTKTAMIMRELLSFQEQESYGKAVRALVGHCKAIGVVPMGAPDGYGINGAEASDPELLKIMAHHGISIERLSRPKAFNTVRAILQRSFSDARLYADGNIDYDDQKWIPACKRPGGKPLAQPIYDVVILDEGQDINSIDLELVKLVLKPGGCVIAVGDTNQSIYGWRGADVNAFGKIVTTFEAAEMPLSITYRCGTKLVEHAQELVPTIQAAPGAVEGEVKHYTTFSPADFQAGDLVMCRQNAPLVAFAYKLMAEKVPVLVKGRDIGSGLVELIKEVAGEKTWVPNPNKPGKKMPLFTVDGVTIPTLLRKLDLWLTKAVEVIKTDDPDNETAIQSVSDKYHTIKAFADQAPANALVTTVVDEIANMFSDVDDASVVLCSTIHKAKGLEADRAFIYAPERLYPAWVQKDTWQHQQETNIDYVARTRGKIFYGYLPEDGWK